MRAKHAGAALRVVEQHAQRNRHRLRGDDLALVVGVAVVVQQLDLLAQVRLQLGARRHVRLSRTPESPGGFGVFLDPPPDPKLLVVALLATYTPDFATLPCRPDEPDGPFGSPPYRCRAADAEVPNAFPITRHDEPDSCARRTASAICDSTSARRAASW